MRSEQRRLERELFISNITLWAAVGLFLLSLIVAGMYIGLAVIDGGAILTIVGLLCGVVGMIVSKYLHKHELAYGKVLEKQIVFC